ncbi:hypothetical protein E9993_00390 [Labilibacter sediminis]|nr:hypothetical protein E9993_00390 [Labilibacter sediminis]
MKKYILLIVVAFATIGVNAQKNEKFIKVRECYVSTIAAEYSLDEDQQESLSEAFTKKSKESNTLKKQMNAGSITKEQRQAKMAEVNAEFFNLLKTLTGKKLKELKAYDKETRAKCINR